MTRRSLRRLQAYLWSCMEAWPGCADSCARQQVEKVTQRQAQPRLGKLPLQQTTTAAPPWLPPTALSSRGVRSGQDRGQGPTRATETSRLRSSRPSAMVRCGHVAPFDEILASTTLAVVGMV